LSTAKLWKTEKGHLGETRGIPQVKPTLFSGVWINKVFVSLSLEHIYSFCIPYSVEPDLVEGQFILVSSNNFEAFLEAVGTGPLSRYKYQLLYDPQKFRFPVVTIRDVFPIVFL
jgi:hypothetical protein